ncbi:MAG: START domain-containing protein [Planctomycetota bacterium]|nr:START domain-containing protein [Planctomycetota bacterium]
MKSLLFKTLVISLLFSAFCDAALAQNRWQKIKEESGVSVYSKAFPGTKIIGFKGIIDIAAPPRKLLHVLMDSKRKGEWVNGLTKSVVLEAVSKHEVIVYESFSLSSLVSDRDIVFRGKVTYNPATGWIRYRNQSESHPKAPPTIGVRAFIFKCDITLIPLNGGTKTRVILETLGDPKGWIPTWLVNKTQKSWPYETLTGLRTQVKKPYYKLYPLPKPVKKKKSSAEVRGKPSPGKSAIKPNNAEGAGKGS